VRIANSHERKFARTESDVQAVEQLDVGMDGVLNLGYADELVGRVAAGGVAGAELERGEGHEGLVAERG